MSLGPQMRVAVETIVRGNSYFDQAEPSEGNVAAKMTQRTRIVSGTTVALLFAFLLATTCFAQSANKIISESLRAQGGKKALARIHSSEWQGTAQFSGSTGSGAFTLVTESPNRFYRELDVGAGRSAEACNGKSCWGDSGQNNVFTFVGGEERLAKAEAQLLNARLLDLKKNKIRARLLPRDTLNGKSADVIELTTASGVTERLYFDSQTHLVVKEVLGEGKADAATASAATASAAQSGATPSSSNANAFAPEEISFSDYRPMQGVMEPFHWELQQGGKTYEIDFSRISLNGAVNESAFNFPSLSSRPLPDIAQLLKDVDANQKKIDKLKENYTCMVRETEQQVDGMGKIKKQTTNLYEESYVAGHEIDRQMEKDGKPFTPEQQKKEDARVQKEVLRDQKKAEEEQNKPKKKKDNDVTIEDFLRISKFTNPRWERFRGQDVVVFDFGPNPDYKPKTLVEKAIHDLEGAVWIDPSERDVVRLEARFDNALKVVGGVLASLQKGSAFVFEQQLMNNEVWLPSYDEIHFGVKLLMVKTVRADEIHQYYDYRKFHVSTKQSIGQPKPRSNIY